MQTEIKMWVFERLSEFWRPAMLEHLVDQGYF